MPCFDSRFASRPGYACMFRPGALTLGVFFPPESYDGPVARMDVTEQAERAVQAGRAGFAALWARVTSRCWTRRSAMPARCTTPGSG